MADDALSLPRSRRALAHDHAGSTSATDESAAAVDAAEARAAADARAADAQVHGYLHHLRRELRGAEDLEEVMDEVADHLWSAVARHEAGGASRPIAVGRALASFGAAPDVGEGLRQRELTGNGVPTPASRLGGLAMRIAAFALPLALVAWVASEAVEASGTAWEGPPQSFYNLGATFLLVANGLALMGAYGLLSRHGSTRRWQSWVGLAFLGVGTFISLAAWALAAWSPFLGLGWIVVGGLAGSPDVMTKFVRTMLQGGFALTFVLVMLAAIATGGDEGGTDWQTYAAIPGLLIQSVAFFLVGSALASETPLAEADPPAAGA